MASSFSNHFVWSCARTRISVTKSPAVRSPAASASFPRSPRCCSPRRLSGLSSSSLARSFPKAGGKVSASNAETVSVEEEERAQGGDQATVKFLIQAYKEAVFNGDEESITKIELEIRALETAKEELGAKINEMVTEIAAGKDKLLRSTADFENFRKRSEKDRISFSSDIQRDVIESLLPIVDSFEESRRQMKPDTEKEKKLDASYQGIYKQFVEILRSLRVSVVQTVGAPFDPSIHEAVGRVETSKFKEGVVVEEIARGFILGDEVLRPAKVKVSAGSGGGAAATSPEQPPAEADGTLEESTPA